MYLKALNVVGFKSFADRTTLEFDRGTTAIVGPNGCGKSNVLDSLRWVLGEQSAKALRGGEMKDVIFSGTDSRPPLGMAEVSLTFGDCEAQLGTEYNEVTITRRVFRDGAGEYEINRTPCRLRDIQTLFMDTGVGRTAYSIMEQGKIDQILSSRPEDRRAIFEEAAGITKYKSQKKEAMRKLEHTEANLLRLADIIREVKRQIGSLQRQAGKARRYRSAFDELAELESRLGRHQFETCTAGIERLQTQLAEARETLEKLTAQMEQQETQVTEARAELAGREAELVAVREEMGAVQHALDRAVRTAQTNAARVVEFTDLRDQARQEVAGIEEKERAAQEQLAHHEAQVEKYTRLQEETRGRFEAEQAALSRLTAEIEEAEAEQAGAEERRLEQQGNQQRHEQELAALESQQLNLRVRAEALSDGHATAQRQQEAAQIAFTDRSARLVAAEAALEIARAALDTARRDQGGAELAAQAATRTAGETLRAHEQMAARREALAQLEAQHASAPQATQRLLLEQGGDGTDFSGTLSQHIRVQSGYEAPLAMLLGEAVNALLLHEDARLQDWREKLAPNEQCAFAPVLAARPSPLPSSAETHASRFVTALPGTADLLRALLEDAHVVDSLSTARALKAAQPHATIATRTGELITRTGLILVGQDAGTSLTVLKRQAELRRLEPELAASAREVEAQRTTADEASRALEGHAAAVEQSRALLQEAEIALAACRQEERAARSTVTDLVRQSEETTRGLAHVSAQQARNDENHDRLQKLLRQAGEERRQAEALVTEADEKLDALAARRQEQDEALTELRVELATQTQQREAWQQQREPVAIRLRELKELAVRRTREAGEHEQRVAQARIAIGEAEHEQEKCRRTEAELAVKLQAGQQARAAAQGRIEIEEASLRKARHEHNALLDRRGELDVQLAEQKSFFGNLRERFQRDYHKQLEDLPPLDESDAAIDWSALETDAASKRAALDQIGPVNLEAITEYDELEQRHQFLTGQENDLLAAKEQIVKAIQEINRTTRKLFAETFEQVQRNFQEMFGELFGGGKASLSLLDESDPLESGIEILARPPGKQNQSVTLLSGGERTMTAVALLFAIYMVKPSPFCVLDELDAPLDESNINRFIKILQRFVQQSQFVVITHNKRTISFADTLYGVTMEERGVSRFVSMRMARRDDVPPRIAQEEEILPDSPRELVLSNGS